MKNQTEIKEICPTTTQEWVKRGALLVDVREKDEVSQLAYDVPNIMNIPLSEFDERYTEIPKDKEVVLVCRGGGRSLKATGILIQHGYDKEKVVNMQHGIIRWVKKGFPTKGDASSVIEKEEGNACCGTAASSTPESCCKSSAEDTKSEKVSSMKITILDPALCCSTGVCGPSVDDSLVQTAANVKWLKSLGYDVHRHGISNDFISFKNYPKAVEKLQKEGVASLPYILINDQLVMSGHYPQKSDWEAWIKKTSNKDFVMAEVSDAADTQQSSNNCSGSGCC